LDVAEIIKALLGQREPRDIEDRLSRYRHAAVLIPLFRDNGEYKILFTKRTNRVDAHKGQISFPGGGIEEQDASRLDTALRESEEEVGIRRRDVSVLGRLDDTYTVASNYVIRPFVGLIPYPYDFRINREEVKRLLQVPLRLFLEKAPGESMGEVDYEGHTYHGITYTYGEDVIWGATARIMGDFVEILGEKIDLPEKT